MGTSIWEERLSLMDLGLVASSVVLGLAYAAAPGVVNTESLRRGIQHGGGSAFRVQTGSLLGDLLWAVVGLTGAVLVAGARPVRVGLGIAGGAFVLRLAWRALEETWARRTTGEARRTSRGDLATGIVFGLANPVGLAFWAGIGSISSGRGGFGLAQILAGFFLGAMVWVGGFSLLVGLGRRVLGDRSLRWVRLGSALVLAFYGIRLLWDSVSLAVERTAARTGTRALARGVSSVA